MLLRSRAMSDGTGFGIADYDASWIPEENHDMLGPLQTHGCTTDQRNRIHD